MTIQTKGKHAAKEKASRLWILGISFTFLIALLGYLLTWIPGFSLIGQLACAIILAVFYRHFFGYPKVLRAGITFSSKRLLRLAIILYGIKLNMAVIFQEGLGLLARDALVIVFAIGLTMWLAKIWMADTSISLLLAIGTGVCGAAAIAAVAPIVGAKEEDTAIGVGIIALMGTVFAISYTLIRPLLPLLPTEFGVWAGMTLHELAHVAIAAEPFGEDVLAIALLAKLGRVFLLLPLCFILIYVLKRKNIKNPQGKNTLEFPWFLLGFIFMSLLGTYVLDKSIPFPRYMSDGISSATTWILTAAMVGLGLNVSLRDLRNRALKPLLVMTITSLCLSVFAYVII